MAEQRQIEGCRETGRAATHHRHLAIGRRQLTRHDAVYQLVVAVRFEDGIGDEAMHFAHVDRAIDGAAAAAVVAGVLAHTPGGRGQGIVEHYRLERVVQPAFLKELQEARNVHVQRTAVLAR